MIINIVLLAMVSIYFIINGGIKTPRTKQTLFRNNEFEKLTLYSLETDKVIEDYKKDPTADKLYDLIKRMGYYDRMKDEFNKYFSDENNKT